MDFNQIVFGGASRWREQADTISGNPSQSFLQIG
jgi:hypothetical protein